MQRLDGRVLAALVWVGIGIGCGDGPTAPSTGTIRVTMRNIGGDLDVDGYTIRIDSAISRQVVGATTIDIAALRAGPHLVVLQDVAENCAVTDGASRSVTVTAGGAVIVSFDVVCVATGIGITIRATGQDIPNSFQVMMD